jgi:MAF protein
MAISKALAAPLESPQALCSEKVYQEKVSVEETHSEKFYTVSARAQNGVLAPQCVILASDTTVVVEGECLGKPVDEADFMRMMQALSGQRHEVHTAVSVRNAQRQDTFLCTSSVWFRPTSLAERQAYWQTGEPADKAGGYAIQGIGAAFVARLDGSYSAVMGLPLRETASLLTEFGVGWALSEVPTSKSGLTGLPIGSTSDPSDDSVTGGPYKH